MIRARDLFQMRGYYHHSDVRTWKNLANLFEILGVLPGLARKRFACFYFQAMSLGFRRASRVTRTSNMRLLLPRREPTSEKAASADLVLARRESLRSSAAARLLVLCSRSSLQWLELSVPT